MSELTAGILQAVMLLVVWIFLNIHEHRSNRRRPGRHWIGVGLGLAFLGSLLCVVQRLEGVGLLRQSALVSLANTWLIHALYIIGLSVFVIGSTFWLRAVAWENLRDELDRKYASVIELTSDWLWEVNDKMEFTHVGPMSKELLGYNKKELIGRTPLSLLPAEDAARARKLFEEYSAPKKSFSGFEAKYLAADGREVFYETAGIPIVDEDGKLLGYRGINKDITTRKKTELELRRRMEMEKNVAELSSLFARLQSHEIDKFIDDALRRIGSICEVDRCYIFLMRDDGVRMDNTHEWCAEGIEPQIYNLQGIVLDDELPWFASCIRKNETVCIPAVEKLPEEAHAEREHFRQQNIKSLLVMPMIIGNELKGFAGFDSVREEKPYSEETIHFLGITCDIIINSIERSRREAALQESEERYRLLAENSSDVIWTTDLNFNWHYISPSIKRLTGLTVQEAIEQPVYELLTPESLMHVERVLKDKLAECANDPDSFNRPMSEEVEVNCKDGSTVWTEVNTIISRDENGRPEGMVGLTRDITERRKHEADLRMARDSAEAANRSKSEFLANMSHEIRTPMTAILGFADILLEDYGEEEKLDAARTIKRNGEHLLAIINDILDLSKIEAGKIVIEQIQVSPGDLIAEVCSLMRVRADAKGLSFSVERKGQIPETICTDPTRLRQILLNVIGNAIKFTEMGSIKLVVSLSNGDSPSPEMEFRVIDTGIGMTEEQIDGLFHAFTQADSSITRKYGGTGLGLTVSKRFAEILGGDIRAESEVGKGSTFVITVATGPLEDVKMIRASRDNGWLAVKPQEEKLSHKRALKGHILLAEDGPDNQRIISFILRKAGAQVSIVENGMEAIETIHKSCHEKAPFNVVLMDMQMPVMDGYDATRQLRSEGYDGIIIALTAHAMSGDREKCIAAGCDGYLTKPIDRGKLLALLGHYYKLSRSSTESRE